MGTVTFFLRHTSISDISEGSTFSIQNQGDYVASLDVQQFVILVCLKDSIRS